MLYQENNDFVAFVKENNKSVQESIEYVKNAQELCICHWHHHILSVIIDFLASKNKKTINYFEIGVFMGGSLATCIQNPNKVKYLGVDTFNRPGNDISLEKSSKSISKFNKFNHDFEILKSDSHDNATKQRVKEYLENIDILFIDGDHTTQGMIKDFQMFSDLVNEGGFIIIDDYETIPDVRQAVNYIINKPEFEKKYDVIGCFDNFFKNKSTRLDFKYRESNRFDGKMIKNNEFIIRKKSV
tara:strand:- start:395 stop:1120 length:726 start_codon:yes stop_codon:yes gene_type:complete